MRNFHAIKWMPASGAVAQSQPVSQSVSRLLSSIGALLHHLLLLLLVVRLNSAHLKTKCHHQSELTDLVILRLSCRRQLV